MANKWQFRFCLVLSQTQRKQVLIAEAEQSLRAVFAQLLASPGCVSTVQHNNTAHHKTLQTNRMLLSEQTEWAQQPAGEEREPPASEAMLCSWALHTLCPVSVLPDQGGEWCLSDVCWAGPLAFLSSKSNIPNKLSGFRNFPCFVHSRTYCTLGSPFCY